MLVDAPSRSTARRSGVAIGLLVGAAGVLDGWWSRNGRRCSSVARPTVVGDAVERRDCRSTGPARTVRPYRSVNCSLKSHSFLADRVVTLCPPLALLFFGPLTPAENHAGPPLRRIYFRGFPAVFGRREVGSQPVSGCDLREQLPHRQIIGKSSGNLRNPRFGAIFTGFGRVCERAGRFGCCRAQHTRGGPGGWLNEWHARQRLPTVCRETADRCR